MKASHFNKDFLEFFELLAKHNVKYLIVGGEAVIYYGYPRLTGDIDIYYELSEENAANLYLTLKDFWGEQIPGIKSKKNLLEDKIIFQFGSPPNRIDIINSIDSVLFHNAWESRVEERIRFKGKTFLIYYIGLDDLIKNKKSVKRFKDLEDLKYLKHLKR